MTLGIGALVALYVVTAAVLLGLCLYSRWRPGAKIAIIALVSAAYVAVYYGLPTRLGWPTDGAVPKKFNLYAIYIQEPDPQTGAKGDVFFWAADMQAGADARPRAYRLPFTPELKAKFTEANGKLRQNIPQIGEAEDDKDPFGVPRNRDQRGQKSAKITLRDAPPDVPPSKEAVR
ncbi:MAG: hypothetical protein HY749_15740 [Gammaproteobacteria bacterium]|nr:hypothetical protein [Gammaproteobacteria bacterium]MBI5617282.1 hypothetical protein [Gammaproteobacteria bacterium]